MTNTHVPPKFKFVDSENKFSLYSNNTGISISAFDIRLIFGQTDTPAAIVNPLTNEIITVSEVTVVQQGSVIMSPLHAKLFSAALLANIANYESMFGKINEPPKPPLAPAKG